LWLNEGAETYFELVVEDRTLTFTPPEPDQESLWKKNLATIVLKPYKSSGCSEISESDFLVEDDLQDERRLFNILLFYLEKFSSLDAIKKNIDEMEEAIEAGNVNKLKKIARDCRDECVNCKISEALPALFVLEQINQHSELLIAGSFINQVKIVHKNFKARLLQKLNKLSEKRENVLKLRASGSGG